MAVWSCSSTKHAAVAQWAANTVYGAGAIVRQLAAPAAGNERCFRTAAGGTSHATTEPTWVLTKGAAQPADGTVSDWLEVTGDSTYGWAVAHARLRTAFPWIAAGDTIYVGDDSAATEAATVTYTSPGTAAAPCYILCVDDSAWPPTALATTATETTTGAFGMTFAGFAYCNGITFNVGTGSSQASVNFVSGSPWCWRFDASGIKLLNTSTASRINIGVGDSTADDNLLELINTNLQFSNASQGIAARSKFRWRGGTLTIGTATTTLFTATNQGVAADVEVIGVDLSGLGSGKSLATLAAASPSCYLFQNCKLGASVSLGTGSPAGPGGTIAEMVNCDSADTNYGYQKSCYQGDIYTESTIVRTGGASDGTTPISRKMVSSANAKYVSPLVLESLVRFYPGTAEEEAAWSPGASKTVTVEVVTDGVTLTDAECWLDVEYLGTSGYPLCVLTSDRAANILATPANQAASTETWTTTGLASPVTQKLSCAITPQEKGPIKVRVMLAKASTIVYVDPKVTLS
jgi:hypothetical protein